MANPIPVPNPMAGGTAPAKVDPKAPVLPGKPVETIKAPIPGEAAKGPETYNITFNGKTVALTAEQIMSLKGKADQFDLTARQKSELEKGLADVLSRIDQDPLGLYAKRGKNVDELVASHFKKMVERDQQDPQARELAELKAYREGKLKEEEAAKQAKEAAEKQTKQRELYQTILKEIDKVLTDKALPKDQITIDRLLRVMAAGKRVRGTNFSVAEAADIVEKEEIKHLGFVAKQLPSEKLKAIFGPDFIKKLNGEQIAALKEADKKTVVENKVAEKSAETKGVDRKKFLNSFNGI